jgi:hypothetical protein
MHLSFLLDFWQVSETEPCCKVVQAMLQSSALG